MPEKLRTLPRWLIFALDLTGVAVALILSRFLRFNFDQHLATNNLSIALGCVLSVNAVLFYLFKSYAGIVRYTTVMDTFRLMAINTIASIIYLLINTAFFQEGILVLSRATILINFFIVSFGLIGYRIVVRYLYKVLFSDQVWKLRIKVAVYDTSEQGLLTKRVINDHPQSRMQVVAFIDSRPQKRGHKMEALPIYGLTDAAFAKMKNEDIRLIVIANKEITGAKLSEVVDMAFQHGIRVQQVPPLQQWLNGKLGAEQLKDVNIEDLLERDVIRINNENIFYSIKGKKILVTGAAGSIGSELVRQLVQFKPALLILCDVAESPLHALVLELQDRFPNAPFKAYIGDICDKVRMEHLFEVYNPEIVFHAAAYKHVPLMEENPSVAIVNNVLGTKTIAELAVANGVEKFVMVSTDKAVNPTNIMGASKRIAEIFIQSYFRQLQQDGVADGQNGTSGNTLFITTRFGNVLGSNGSVIPRFRQQIEKGGPVTVTHPDITRYFMTIPEACQLVIEAGVMGQGGEIFVFDMGDPVKVADLAHKMIRLSGKTPGIDINIIFTGLRPGEKLYEELLNDKENTIPTYHDKIMIAKVREYDFTKVCEKIDKLIHSASRHYTYETVAIMKDLVPEFISNNSAFETLDVKAK